MKVINEEGKILEVTEKAFRVVYKDRGFKAYDESKVNYNDLKVDELKDLLEQRNIEYSNDLRKAELIELLEK